MLKNTKVQKYVAILMHIWACKTSHLGSNGQIVVRETGREVFGASSGQRMDNKETRWWNEERQDRCDVSKEGGGKG